MTKKEIEIQNALGTMKKQMFISADWSDIEGLVDEFEKALKNFGLFMYNDPGFEGTDCYGFVISNETLTDEQIAKLCACEDEEEKDEDE